MSTVIEPVMSVPAPKVITPEDLLRMGDEGKQFELVDGSLVERNVSTESSYVAGEVFFALKAHARGLGYVFPADASFQCFAADSRRVRRPDVAFVTVERLPPDRFRTEGHCTSVPDLVVEVISPNDYAKAVNQKIAEWLGAGVRLVWVIDPDARTVFGYHADRPDTADIRREADTLTGDPVLPGFAVPVAELFRLPPPKPSPAG